MATVTEAGVALEAQKDHIMWLVQRYGYARRNLKHQGRTAAEWFRSINTALNVAELLALVAAEDKPEHVVGRMEELDYLNRWPDPYIRPQQG